MKSRHMNRFGVDNGSTVTSVNDPATGLPKTYTVDPDECVSDKGDVLDRPLDRPEAEST